jgi:L-glutamine-phosphate cytidylyltransferase
MKAIILAAGRGSRMKDLTDGCPKCLVALRGKTLLDLQLEALRAAGIDEIGIVTGYKSELLAGRGLDEFYNSRWAETNMVSSLACAESWLRAEPCIVSYSDIFYAPVAVQSLMNCTSALAVTYDPNWLELWTRRFGDPLLDAETFRLNASSILEEIGNKPRSVEEIDGQYMGLLRMTPEGWEAIQKVRVNMGDIDRDQLQITGVLQSIISQNYLSVLAIPNSEPWGEVDSEADLTVYCNQS